jgi:predicted RNase H-like HicB family nuclease
MRKATSQTYSYSVFYDEALEGGFVVFVPMLPGCHSQGGTLEEARGNITQAIRLYLESLRAHKEPVPGERHAFQGVVTVAIPSRG